MKSRTDGCTINNTLQAIDTMYIRGRRRDKTTKGVRNNTMENTFTLENDFHQFMMCIEYWRSWSRPDRPVACRVMSDDHDRHDHRHDCSSIYATGKHIDR